MRLKLITPLLVLALSISACLPVQNPNDPAPTATAGNQVPPTDPAQPYPNPGEEGEGPIPPAFGYQTPYPPVEEESLIRAELFIDSASVIVMESFPIQAALKVTGNLPTPCNQIQWTVSAPDAENKIAVDLYSLVNPGENCIQVLDPFDVNIPLGSFTSGHFTVWLNSEAVGEFSSP